MSFHILCLLSKQSMFGNPIFSTKLATKELMQCSERSSRRIPNCLSHAFMLNCLWNSENPSLFAVTWCFRDSSMKTSKVEFSTHMRRRAQLSTSTIPIWVTRSTKCKKISDVLRLANQMGWKKWKLKSAPSWSGNPMKRINKVIVNKNNKCGEIEFGWSQCFCAFNDIWRVFKHLKNLAFQKIRLKLKVQVRIYIDKCHLQRYSN